MGSNLALQKSCCHFETCYCRRETRGLRFGFYSAQCYFTSILKTNLTKKITFLGFLKLQKKRESPIFRVDMSSEVQLGVPKGHPMIIFKRVTLWRFSVVNYFLFLNKNSKPVFFHCFSFLVFELDKSPIFLVHFRSGLVQLGSRKRAPFSFNFFVLTSLKCIESKV